MNYETESTKRLKWLLWANLQDTLHRSDIVDRITDEKHRAIVQSAIERSEHEIAAIRAELERRKV